MSNILKTICDKRREDVINAKSARAESALLQDIKFLEAPRPFAQNLKDKAAAKEIGLIAEVKRASPSQGDIRPDFDAADCAKIYQANGATCLSVLTEPHWFKGQDEYIDIIKQSGVTLPVLRKDFMVDPYQIVESRYLGADCILIIMAALDDALAKDLCQTARDMGLSILIEVHDTAEHDRALNLDFDLLGINNRNLKTMATDIETSITIKKDVPPEVTVVSESGLNTHDDLQHMMAHDMYCFLVGTSLMRQPNLGAATASLLGN